MARTKRTPAFPKYFYAWSDYDRLYWEQNIAGRDGNSLRYWNPEVKAVTRRERRRDWKRQERKIMLCADYDDIDVPRLEKKYLGKIRAWI